MFLFLVWLRISELPGRANLSGRHDVTVAGMALAFVGLIVALPVAGHAYRAVIRA